MRALIALAVTFFLAAGTAFGESPKNSRAAECESGLKRAYHELDVAKARGLGGAWEITKATTLLTGAKIQSEFHKYPNCIDKVRRARAFIARSGKK